MTTTTRPARTAGTPHPAGCVRIQLTPGPVCEQSQEFRPRMCGHHSCKGIAIERCCGPYDDAGLMITYPPASIGGDDDDEPVFCTVHWTWAYIDETTSFSGTGFAGGAIYHIWWTCGCQDHDESGDVAAAV